MNNADITAFDNRVDTFGDNVRKFAERIKQVQQQMQELLNSFSDVDQNQNTEPIQMNNQSDSQTVKPQAPTDKQPEVQASTTIAPSQVPSESAQQVSSKPAQSTSVTASQDAMDIINSINIPSLLDVGNKLQASTMQSSASDADDSAFTEQPTTVQSQEPVQTTSKHKTALDNDEMVKAANEMNIDQLIDNVLQQPVQKHQDL